MERILIGFLYLFGIFLIVIGALSVFATDLIRRKFFNKLLQITDIKKYGPLPIAVGVLLSFSAPYDRYMFFVLCLGILSIVKGIMLIVATEKMEKIKNWWLKATNNVYRIYGIAVIIIGSVVLMGI